MRANRIRSAWAAGGWGLMMALCLHPIPQRATGDDAGVTIQTSRGGYAGTQSLTPAILSKLKVSADSDNTEEIATALRQLKDGDVLALAIHSNPDVFGMGTSTPKWSQFWKTFGIEKPPRLSAVIIGGCMVKEVGKGEEENFTYVTPEQVKALREQFNSEVIYVPKGGIKPSVAINDTNGLLESLLVTKKKLCDVNLQGRWQHDISDAWAWEKVTLKDLRLGIDVFKAREAGMAIGMLPPEKFSPELMREEYSKYNKTKEAAEAFKEGYRAGSAQLRAQ